jgi:hypothetical protein
MKSRDAYWAVLLSVIANFLYALFVQPWVEPLKRACVDLVPWVENLLSQPRDRLLRIAGWTLALSVLLVGLLLRAPTLWRWLRNVVARRLRSRRGQTLALTGVGMSMSTGAGSLTPLGALASPTPQFVNNSQWMQWEAYQRQHDLQARFAMASTMPRFPPALLSPPPGT